MAVYKFKCGGCGATQCEKDDNGYRCIYCGNVQDVIFPKEETKEESESANIQQPVYYDSKPVNRETKSLIIRLILCLICGTFGVHKFIEGKIISGIFYIFTGGIFGIGIFFDVIKYIVALAGSHRANGDRL